MTKKFSFLALVAVFCMSFVGCRATMPGNEGTGAIAGARQALEDLPEPTFESLEVYTHDYAARGIAALVEKNPDTKVPLRIFSDSALSILENEQITMVDVIAISESLDTIKDGQVKVYLDLAWTLLELNGVIRRNDATATLTAREQRLLIALFKGVKLGTEPKESREGVLNGYGPRYGPGIR